MEAKSITTAEVAIVIHSAKSIAKSGTANVLKFLNQMQKGRMYIWKKISCDMNVTML